MKPRRFLVSGASRGIGRAIAPAEPSGGATLIGRFEGVDWIAVRLIDEPQPLFRLELHGQESRDLYIAADPERSPSVHIDSSVRCEIQMDHDVRPVHWVRFDRIYRPGPLIFFDRPALVEVYLFAEDGEDHVVIFARRA